MPLAAPVTTATFPSRSIGATLAGMAFPVSRTWFQAAADPGEPSPAERAAARSTARLVEARTAEAEALLAAGMAVMVRNGTTKRATVAEIVKEAGLSNQAFYRHFAGKDDLVAALIDAGARRLAGYLEHRMAATDDPGVQVRTWIEGVLAQVTDPAVAAPTRAVAWNRGPIGGEADDLARRAERSSFGLLEAPLAALGRPDPAADAYLIGTLVFRVLGEALDADPGPTAEDLAFVTDFCLAAVAR
jgi:AcrR family transcriptional regulator